MTLKLILLLVSGKTEEWLRRFMLYRNVTKCKICADYIPSNAKLTHLTEWRSPAKVLSFIESGDAEKLKLCFQHGADINAKIPEEGNASKKP